MFKTHAGPWRTRATWPTCAGDGPGHVLNFSNILNTTRKEAAPFGIARWQVVPQRDHAAELRLPHPRFEQMEMEYFVPPAEAEKWFEYWLAERLRWYSDLGIPEDKLHLRHHDRPSCRTTRAARPTWSSSSLGWTSSRGSPTGATST